MSRLSSSLIAKNKNQSIEPKYLRQIVTLYDGDHFGEIALIDLEQKEDISVLSPPKKRNANWIAVERTTMLEIPHHSWIQAYQASGAKNMKERLDFLKKLYGFKMIDKNTLLPLASNLRIKVYKMGEYIIKQREIPSGLIIISKGEWQVVYEKNRKREFKNNVYTKLNPKEMNTHFNDFNDVRYETTSGFNSRVIKLKTKDPDSHNESDEKHGNLLIFFLFLLNIKITKD